RLDVDGIRLAGTAADREGSADAGDGQLAGAVLIDRNGVIAGRAKDLKDMAGVNRCGVQQTPNLQRLQFKNIGAQLRIGHEPSKAKRNDDSQILTAPCNQFNVASIFSKCKDFAI